MIAIFDWYMYMYLPEKEWVGGESHMKRLGMLVEKVGLNP